MEPRKEPAQRRAVVPWLWGASFVGPAGAPGLKMLRGAACKVPGAEIPALPAADFQASASAPAAWMRRALSSET